MKPVTLEEKKRIYRILADAYLEVLRRQELGKFERKVLSQKILDGMESANTMEDVRGFLGELVKNYPYFAFARKMFKSEIAEIQQGNVISRLEQFIHSQSS